MSRRKSLPRRLATIRDQAVNCATENGTAPGDIEELYEWLVWESESEELYSDDWFFDVNSLHLFDEDLRDFLELSDDAPVSNSLRLKYTRALIDRHADAQETDGCACAFKLKKRGKPETFACCLGFSAGQGGPEYEWFGLFPSKAEFFRHLESKGWMRCGTPSSSVSDEAILRLWQRQ